MPRKSPALGGASVQLEAPQHRKKRRRPDAGVGAAASPAASAATADQRWQHASPAANDSSGNGAAAAHAANGSAAQAANGSAAQAANKVSSPAPTAGDGEQPGGAAAGASGQPLQQQSPAEAAQAVAVDLLEQGAFGRALAAAAAAAQLPGGDALEASLATLRLICRLHLAGSSTSCWQVLGLAEGASAEDVRRTFRRGAARVHPDKCRLPRAEAAFKLLAAATEQAMSASGGKGRQPTAAHADFGRTYSNGGGGAPWWEEWDPSEAENKQQQQQQRGAAKKPKPWQAPADSDAQHLSALGVQALKAEVVRRQGAVLSPEPGSEEAKMDPMVRQARLREARSLLSERVKHEEAAAFAAQAGGFHPEAPHFARHV